MAYLTNTSRKYSLLVNGQDYSAQMISWTASDSSSFKTGLGVTTGALILGFGYKPNSPVSDYDKNEFRRGTPVVLDIVKQDGTTSRHPRGLLYVLGVSYDVEQETLTVDIGCKIALANLVNDARDLLPFAPVALDPLRRNIQGVAGALAVAGQVLYQDNQGVLKAQTFFDQDRPGYSPPPAWVSILGKTATSVKPLAGSGVIPDIIRLGYNYTDSPAGAVDRIDIVTTESQYWGQYPASHYVRTGDGTIGGAGEVQNYTPVTTPPASACGNAPPPPAGSERPTSCNDGYELQQSPLLMTLDRLEVATTEYNAPGGQVSLNRVSRYSPAFESNGQYYADKFAYCRFSWSTACNPNGNCPIEGVDPILTSETVTTNYYGDANELVKTVTDEYQSILAGAQNFDWRAGVVAGVPQGFREIDPTQMYRVRRTENVIYSSGNSNVQETSVWTSPTARQSGIRAGNIDAMAGLKNFTRRTSTTISNAPFSPDTVNSPETATSEGGSAIILRKDAYLDDPRESGPYLLDEQAPVPLLASSRGERDDMVRTYSEFLRRFTLGESYGLQVGEALRDEVVDSWEPGLPFRYYDTSTGDIFAIRMDATSWGVDSEGASFVTNGIWIGNSNGTIDMPNNTVGNPGAPAASGDPVIVGETVVDTGSIAFSVDIEFSMSGSMDTPYGSGDGTYLPADSRYDGEAFTTAVMRVSGQVFAAGSLMNTAPDGGLPASNAGSIVLAGAVVVDPDLFAT